MKQSFVAMAKLVRVEREISEHSQESLAKELGYTQGQFLSNVERGVCTLPPKHWKKLAKLIHVSLEDLIEARLQDECMNLIKLTNTTRRYYKIGDI